MTPTDFKQATREAEALAKAKKAEDKAREKERKKARKLEKAAEKLSLKETPEAEIPLKGVVAEEQAPFPSAAP